MHNLRLACALAVALSPMMTSCDDTMGSSPNDPDAAGPDSSPPSDAAITPPDASRTEGTFRLVAGPHTAMPGEEQTLCVVLDLGNGEPGMVREVRTSLSPGSHHMIVQRMDSGTAQPTPVPCGGFSHSGHVIFLSQQAEAGITYPTGTGLPVSAHQLIGIEMHFINYISADPVEIMGSLELDVVPLTGELEEVDVLFTGELSITLPPRERTTVVSHYPTTPSNRVFALTTHTHQLGVEATLERVGMSGETTLLHRSISWAEPPLNIFDPPLQFHAGDQIRLTCVYENTTDAVVSFGVGFEDEMCFFWTYHY